MAGLDDWRAYINKRHLLTGRSDDNGITEKVLGQGLEDLRERARMGVQLGLRREALDAQKQIQEKSLENARINHMLNYTLTEQGRESQSSGAMASSLINAPISLAYAKRLYNIL